MCLSLYNVSVGVVAIRFQKTLGEVVMRRGSKEPDRFPAGSCATRAPAPVAVSTDRITGTRPPLGAGQSISVW